MVAPPDTGADRPAYGSHRSAGPITFISPFLHATDDALGMAGMGRGQNRQPRAERGEHMNGSAQAAEWLRQRRTVLGRTAPRSQKIQRTGPTSAPIAKTHEGCRPPLVGTKGGFRA